MLPSADTKRREGARRLLDQLRTQLLPREMSRAVFQLTESSLSLSYNLLES